MARMMIAALMLLAPLGGYVVASVMLATSVYRLGPTARAAPSRRALQAHGS